jgi:hypothetical protein
MKSSSGFVGLQLRLVAGFLVFSVVTSQTGFAAGMQAAAGPAGQTAAAGQTITVAPGTVVPLTLVSPIKSKSTKVGDTVRAQVAFPVTVGTQVAIPAGTYVEGVVTSLTAQAKRTHQPDLQIHFTRLLYANGYTASLEAVNMQAKGEVPGSASPVVASVDADAMGYGAGRTHIVFYGGEGFTSRAQTTTEPTLPPLPHVGPPAGVIVGVSLGVVVAILTIGILSRRHRGNADYVLYDAGWQFQMAISTPLTVDAGQVAAAAATVSH